MKILGRILLFILVLALLAGLLMTLSWFVAIPWVSDFTVQMTRGYFWMPLALGIVVLFFMAVCVLALVLLVSVPTKRNLYLIKRDAGNIEITKHSIENAVGGTLESMRDVKRYHVRLKGNPKPHKLRVKLQVEPRDNTVHLGQLGADVQQRVQDELAQSLAIEPGRISVKIQSVQYQQQEGRQHGHSRVPRVV